MLIHPDSLFYATPELDRMALMRTDSRWVEDRKESGDSGFLLVHDTRNLFLKEGEKYLPAFLQFDQLSAQIEDCPSAYLGRSEDRDIFVFDVTKLPEEKVLLDVGANYCFEDLRRAGPLHHKIEAAQMAYGRALMFWHARHLFCGACGSETESREAGHVRKCLNPTCALEHFPRTDPAVIMLVCNEDKCLLAHSKRLKAGMYSTLAGFVEPGETLEQAVQREVMEEAGIRVADVVYAGSQPWPFPTSLMIGFYAEAETTVISLEDDELLDAQWFSREDLRNFKKTGRFLPSRDSIARNLIEKWLIKG